MRFKYLVLSFAMAAFLFGTQQIKAEAGSSEVSASEYSIAGGKEKKEKEKKGKAQTGKKQKLSKPSKSAHQSAKDAKNAMKLKRKQVMGRAKVRNFFHNMFNTKYGKPVNFRSKRQRNRWKKGRMG